MYYQYFIWTWQWPCVVATVEGILPDAQSLELNASQWEHVGQVEIRMGFGWAKDGSIFFLVPEKLTASNGLCRSSSQNCRLVRGPWILGRIHCPDVMDPYSPPTAIGTYGLTLGVRWVFLLGITTSPRLHCTSFILHGESRPKVVKLLLNVVDIPWHHSGYVGTIFETSQAALLDIPWYTVAHAPNIRKMFCDVRYSKTMQGTCFVMVVVYQDDTFVDHHSWERAFGICGKLLRPSAMKCQWSPFSDQQPTSNNQMWDSGIDSF